MKLQKFSGKPRKPRIIFRRIVGPSMLPVLSPGQVVCAISIGLSPNIGDVIIAFVDGKEIVKRIAKIDQKRVFLIGDNQDYSTDSRSFGWVDFDQILGQIIWPKHLKN